MITRDVLEAALAGDYSKIKALPKTDLHAHLVLSAPFETYQRISKGKITAPPKRFHNLDHFLQYVREEFFPILDSIDAYVEIMRDCFAYMIADGIVYTEVSYDLAMPLLVKSTWSELFPIFATEIDRVKDKLQVRPELGLSRDFSFGAWQDGVDEALATDFFTSIDLYGAETFKPVSEFAHYFADARKKGIKIKLHSGETGDAARVREEFLAVRPDAIQHGVRASEDDGLMELLATSGTEINVCPYSNYCLRVVESYEKHPIRRMFDHGLKITVNSDDLAVFGKGVSDEYVMLYQAGVFNAVELDQIRLNGLSAYKGVI